MQLNRNPLPLPAAAQPSEPFEVGKIGAEKPRLQMPGRCQIPHRNQQTAVNVCMALKMPIERGHPHGTAGGYGAVAMGAELLESAESALYRFCANGVKTHRQVRSMHSRDEGAGG